MFFRFRTKGDASATRKHARRFLRLLMHFFKVIGRRANINIMSSLNMEIIIRNSLNAFRLHIMTC